MNESDRQTLIRLQREKAERFLRQAEEMRDLHYLDLAANRYYYACFHAVQALFLRDSISAHTHAGVVAQFSLHYIKSGSLPLRYGSLLARMMQLRQKADYNCAYDISEEELCHIAPLAVEFVETIVGIL